MKQLLTPVIALLNRSNRPIPIARPNNRALLSLEGLETRWAPAVFHGYVLDAGSVHESDDVIVGANINGHVKVW